MLLVGEVRVACCRSVRKKATSIISSTESKESSAVTSNPTPKAMPSDVARGAQGPARDVAQRHDGELGEQLEGTSRPSEQLRGSAVGAGGCMATAGASASTSRTALSAPTTAARTETRPAMA